MTSTEIENLKKQLKSSFEEHQKNRVHFISDFLIRNKQTQNPIDLLLRSLPDKYRYHISWNEVESAIDLWNVE